MRGETLQTYSVVIADDHALVRRSIRQILEGSPAFRIVGEADDGVSAAAVVKAEKPDLIVLDIAMPHVTGAEAIEEVRRWSPSTKIAVVTGMTGKGLLRHIHESGVEGVFLKSRDPSGWLMDLLAICQGETRIDPKVLEIVEEVPSTKSLTGRERQILFAVARGENNAAIAGRLNISASTVDKHRTNIMRKLGVHSATELVARAFRDGLLDSGDQD